MDNSHVGINFFLAFSLVVVPKVLIWDKNGVLFLFQSFEKMGALCDIMGSQGVDGNNLTLGHWSEGLNRQQGSKGTLLKGHEIFTVASGALREDQKWNFCFSIHELMLTLRNCLKSRRFGFLWIITNSLNKNWLHRSHHCADSRNITYVLPRHIAWEKGKISQKPVNNRGMILDHGRRPGPLRGPVLTQILLVAHGVVPLNFNPKVAKHIDDRPGHKKDGGLHHVVSLARGFWGVLYTDHQDNWYEPPCQDNELTEE